MTQSPIRIDAAFDSGNIDVLSIDGAAARLAIGAITSPNSPSGSTSAWPARRAAN
jgi:hypothetical protein